MLSSPPSWSRVMTGSATARTGTVGILHPPGGHRGRSRPRASGADDDGAEKQRPSEQRFVRMLVSRVRGGSDGGIHSFWAGGYPR
jgi:hypothetical protein